METQKTVIVHKLKLLEQEEITRNENSFESQLMQTEQETKDILSSIENVKKQFEQEEKELNELKKLTMETDNKGVIFVM